MILGSIINWWIAIPIVSTVKYDTLFGNNPPLDTIIYATTVWSKQTRYLGVGAMLVGGFWTLVTIRNSLVNSVKASFKALRSRSSVPKVGFPQKSIQLYNFFFFFPKDSNRKRDFNSMDSSSFTSFSSSTFCGFCCKC